MNVPSLASSIVQTAGVALLHATVLALATGVFLRLTGRRIRPSLQAVLWTIVLVKLFVPPVLPGELTLSRGLSAVVSPALPGPAPPPAIRALPAEWVAVLALPAEPAGPPSPIPLVLFAAYLIGFLIVVPRSLVRSFRTWRRVRDLPRAPGEVAEEVSSLARRIGLRRAPEVLTSLADSSPFVAGIARPVLVLPRSVLEATSPMTREPLVLHELAHLSRRDLWVRLLQNAARLVYYFWPPVWWICRSIERACELACDERALSQSAVPPRLYAATLLEVVRGRRDTSLEAQALALAPSGRFLQERFEMILNHEKGKSSRKSVLAFAAIIGWAAFSLGGGTPAGEKKQIIKETKVVLNGDGGEIAGGRWSTLLLIQPSADRNGDGEVTDEEAMAFAESKSASEKARIFKLEPQADRDGDGSLDSRELYRLFDDLLNTGRPFGLGLGRVPMKMNPKESDTNGDGKITEEEAEAYVASHPDVPVQFEIVTEEDGPNGRNVDRKVIHFVPQPKKQN